MLGVISQSGLAHAQNGDSFRVVVVDTQKIYREAIALKQLEEELDGKRAAYRDELRDKEKEVRVADRELASQRSVLSSEEFTKRRRALEQQMFTLQRELQGRKQAIDQHFAKGMARLQAQLSEIVQEIAERRHADLVLAKSAVIVIKPEFEITREALRELNKRLPRIELPAEEY
jgi:Skp family chaperone for outer membrane proteins